ncbi:VTT domain-containing protein [uncultured Parasutterella sp.]
MFEHEEMDFLSVFLELFRNSDQFIAHMAAQYGAYVYLFLFTVYFLETGVAICALLPGDSLIFVTGAAAAAGILNPVAAFFAIALGACVGNTVAYGLGYWLGNKIYDGSIKWIDQDSMAKTKAFFAKHGNLTILLARFVPIVRSFAPLVAGAAKMNRLRFEASGTLGAVLWAGIIVTAGYLFGNIPFIKNNLSLILVGGIVLGLAPFVIGFIVKKWRQHPDR